ncbi:MAG: translocation/assembly module TamB, partial [Puniceicoccales bacterium]|nr:translocation/assembly module TamB [Puniceicoccales bacterium]
MKILRNIFLFIALSLILLLFAGIFATQCFMPRLAKFLKISHGPTKTEKASHIELCDVRWQLGNVQFHGDKIMLLKPLFFLPKILTGNPKGHHMQVGILTISLAKNLRTIDNSDEKILRMLRYAIATLKNPLLRLVNISIDRIQWEEGPLWLKNVQLKGNMIHFQLWRNEEERILTCSLQINALRGALRTMQREIASEEKISKILPHAAIFMLQKLNGTLQFHQFPISLVAPLLPVAVKPQGIIHGDLQFRDGMPVGLLSIVGLQSRPISGIGVMHDLQCSLKFEPNTIAIEGIEMCIKRGQWHMDGTIHHDHWRNPLYRLHAQGKNVPLLQSAGLDICGNVDCQLDTMRRGNRRTTRLTGNVELLPSIWLMEGMQPLTLPHLTEGNEKLFPEDWNLSIRVNGERFLRINTPYFRGIISAQATVNGTFVVPVIYAQAVVSEGSILFPFARFRITHGTITIDPTHGKPLWNVDSEAQLHNYDLRLHLGGNGNVPVFNFSSTPSLSNGDIVAMLTTGRLPDQRRIISGERNPFGALSAYFGMSILGNDFTDRMRLQVGQNITESGKETMELEYIIDGRHSILAEYDRYDNYGMDIRLKIYPNGRILRAESNP